MTEQTFRRFIDKWVTPTTVMIFFGAIVWGVQLNIQTLNLTRSDEAQNEKIAELSEIVAALSTNVTRQSLILDRVEIRMRREDERLQKQINSETRARLKHNDEAEKWKRAIEVNSNLLRNGANRKNQ